MRRSVSERVGAGTDHRSEGRECRYEQRCRICLAVRLEGVNDLASEPVVGLGSERRVTDTQLRR